MTINHDGTADEAERSLRLARVRAAMSIGLGIAGLGPAGAAMLGAAFGHDQVSVVAVADTDIEWLGPGAGAGEPRRYRSLERLLEEST